MTMPIVANTHADKNASVYTMSSIGVSCHGLGASNIGGGCGSVGVDSLK